MQSTLKKKLGNNESAIGAWISSGSPNLVDLLRKLNFDWFVFDMEHSAISIETVGRMIQVLNGSTITPLVRVGQIDQASYHHIQSIIRRAAVLVVEDADAWRDRVLRRRIVRGG